MQQSGLGPNVITYSAAISVCEKGQQWQQAVGSLTVMHQSGLLPNVNTYSAAISACEKGEQWQQALVLLVLMQQSGYQHLQHALLRAGADDDLWEWALGLLGYIR
jgi:pentatricopeptide repeat domain-containing protein 1